MASALDGSLVDNLAVVCLVAMLCAGFLGALGCGGEAVTSLGVLEFVVVHHCYYLLVIYLSIYLFINECCSVVWLRLRP